MKSCDISESARSVLKMKTIDAKIFFLYPNAF